MKNGVIIEKQQSSAHFHLSYLFNCYLVKRKLLSSRDFIIFLFGYIRDGSFNILVCTTSLHVSQVLTYFKL